MTTWASIERWRKLGEETGDGCWSGNRAGNKFGGGEEEAGSERHTYTHAGAATHADNIAEHVMGYLGRSACTCMQVKKCANNKITTSKRKAHRVHFDE
jgi:hypothetical protein